MRLALVGAGAIGAYLGARLSLAGHEVFLIARGPHLRAMQADGVRVRSPEGDFQARPVATDDYDQVGEVDVVFLTVKAHGLPEVAPRLGPLLGSQTAVVSAQNGIPWWYFQRHGGPWDGRPIESLDPHGVVSSAIPAERVIGCIVYPSAYIAEPGVVEHVEGDRLAIGEPDGAASDRCRRLADALKEAGLRCRVRSRIRIDMWVKLLGNVAFNPISALTRATLIEIARHPEARALASSVMAEADAVARALGVRMPISVERRIAGAAAVGAHKTSMLQDLESGRPMELDAIVGAVIELGEMLDIPVPNTRNVYAAAKLLDEIATRDRTV